MVTIFFSYSHRDEALRDELEIHLSALKRQGIIDTWHDRRIVAGSEIDHTVSKHLEQAGIILLLVSPYFIASDYCYGIELKRAMERNDSGAARVIPVILHPCDWQSLPFGKLMVTPIDGKPVSMFPNQHVAFLQISLAIRKATEDMNAKITGASSSKSSLTMLPLEAPTTVPAIRSSNLRVKKTFNDIDKDRFLTEAFAYIEKFFEGSLEELRKRNSDVDAQFRRIDANQFTAAIYRNGAEVNRCKIWLSGRKSFPGGIAYAVGNIIGTGSYNESLTVSDDGYMLFLKPMGMLFRGRVENDELGFEGASEYLWGTFIEPMQR